MDRINIGKKTKPQNMCGYNFYKDMHACVILLYSYFSRTLIYQTICIKLIDIQVIENAMLQVHANGNINVTWNPITFSQRLQNTIGNATVKYQISITNDKSGETMSECIERSVISTNKIHHEFQHSGDGNQSQCETFTFRITPIINGDVDSAGRTTVVSQGM